jgi:hypothetical protein
MFCRTIVRHYERFRVESCDPEVVARDAGATAPKRQ